jgi:hypothetical protein
LEIIGKGEYFSTGFVERCSDMVEKLVSSTLDNYDKLEQEAQKKSEESNN